MAALIRCHFRLSKKDFESLPEDEMVEMWGQLKYYLEVVNQVSFK